MCDSCTYLIAAKGVYDSELRQLRERTGVLVQGAQIVAVQHIDELIAANPNVRILNYKDYYLFPGLINTHVHLECNPNEDFSAGFLADTSSLRLARAMIAAQAMLQSGVTTVRDAGGSWGILELLNPRMEKIAHLPRLQLAGPPITITGGHMHYFGGEADTLNELLRAVRLRQKLGCEAIKIVVTGGQMTPRSGADRVSYSSEQIRVISDEAHHLGLRTFAHCLTAQGFVNAVQGRVQSIEHCAFFVFNKQNGLLERVYDASTAEKFSGRKIFFSKTMASLWRNLDRARSNGNEITEKEKFLLRQEKNMFDNFLNLKKLGFLPVLATDAGVPKTYFDETWLELEIMVKYCGLSPEEAIEIGTINSASCLGIEKNVGMIKSGYSADIIGLEENPLKNIDAYRNVQLVISRGKVVKESCCSGRRIRGD